MLLTALALSAAISAEQRATSVAGEATDPTITTSCTLALDVKKSIAAAKDLDPDAPPGRLLLYCASLAAGL